MKYPIGMQSFDQIREMGFVYVDKTDMVYRLATEGKIYFLSRPRRFGKSLLVSTLKHYFLGHKELFQGLAIEQLEQEKTAIEQQVKLEMQDAAYGTAPGYKVSWVSSESKRVDSQRLRKEQPDIFNQYSKNVSSRRFTIVHAARFCTAARIQK